MRGRIPDKNIWLVYVTIFLLGVAYGVSLAVLALFLDARSFSKTDIGSLAAWFALGIVTFSLPVGALIRRYSARRTLIASLLGYTATVAAFPFLPTYATVALARFLDGAFSVGVWVSCETILLSRADRENKAFVTSLYAISLAIGYVVGPIAARWIVISAALPLAFVIAGILGAIASVVVWLRLDRDVADADHRADETRRIAQTRGFATLGLFWRIKTSCFATFAYGYFQASVVLFLPLYLIEAKHIARDQTTLIPAFFAAGMLLFSNYAARLGDRYGHLRLMRLLGLIGMTMILGFVFLNSFVWMCGAVFIAGGTLASISPVSLALQGVIADAREYSRSNAIYNAFYAAGMLLGPPTSSRLYESHGGGAMLYHLAALWAAFVLFTVVFFRDDPAIERLARAA